MRVVHCVHLESIVVQEARPIILSCFDTKSQKKHYQRIRNINKSMTSTRKIMTESHEMSQMPQQHPTESLRRSGHTAESDPLHNTFHMGARTMK